MSQGEVTDEYGVVFKPIEFVREYGTNAFLRVFVGICTIGFHELIVKRWWRCAECNTVNGEHDLLDNN